MNRDDQVYQLRHVWTGLMSTTTPSGHKVLKNAWQWSSKRQWLVRNLPWLFSQNIFWEVRFKTWRISTAYQHWCTVQNDQLTSSIYLCQFIQNRLFWSQEGLISSGRIVYKNSLAASDDCSVSDIYAHWNWCFSNQYVCWIIRADVSGYNVRVEIDSFNTQVFMDTVAIYDGKSQ